MPYLAKFPEIDVINFNKALEKIQSSEALEYRFSFDENSFLKDVLTANEIEKLGKIATAANASQLLFYPNIAVHRACFIDDDDYEDFVKFVHSRQVQFAYAYFRKALAPTGIVFFQISEEFDNLISLVLNQGYYANLTIDEVECEEFLIKFLHILEQFFSYVKYEEIRKAAEHAHQKIFQEAVQLYGPLKDKNGNTMKKFL